MIRRNFMINNRLDKAIDEASIREQVSRSEILRRALDVYFAKLRKERKDEQARP